MGRTNWPARPAPQGPVGPSNYDPTSSLTRGRSRPLDSPPSRTHAQALGEWRCCRRRCDSGRRRPNPTPPGKIFRRYSPVLLRLAVLHRLPYTAVPLCVRAPPTQPPTCCAAATAIPAVTGRIRNWRAPSRFRISPFLRIPAAAVLAPVSSASTS
jgi:hypothetical protein